MSSTLDLTQVIHTNAAYTDTERKIISAALSDAKARLALILREKEELEERIGRYTGAIAPHKRLPFEILRLIFRLHCGFCKLDPIYCGNLARKFPVFVLMQVCSEWQQIVLKMPELWSAVRTGSDPRSLSFARRWLSRAGNIPRTLEIFVHRDLYITDAHNFISQYPFRVLQYFSHLVDTDPLMGTTEIETESLLPLEELVIIDCKSTSHVTSAFSSQPFPNLLSLRVSGPFEVQWIGFAPRPALRKLLLDQNVPLSLSEGLTILRQATALEQVTMTTSIGQETALLGNIVAPNLSFLNVCFTSSCNVAPFLDSLTLPRLTSLMIRCECYPGTDVLGCDISVFRRLGARSGMELEGLAVYKTTSPLSVGALLDWMPSLRSLKLFGDCLFDADSIKRIASGNLGPRLEVLCIRVQADTPSYVEPIISMVESRQSLAQNLHPGSRGTMLCFKKVQIFTRDRSALNEEYAQRISRLEILEFVPNVSFWNMYSLV